jgi:hypothetical protein
VILELETERLAVDSYICRPAAIFIDVFGVLAGVSWLGLMENVAGFEDIYGAYWL